MFTRTKLTLILAGLAAASLTAGAPALADPPHGDHHAVVVFTVDDSSHGNPEGVTRDSRFFYVGATADGTIYRGRLGDPTVHTFIPGAAGRAAIGMKASGGLLYVAGGPTGKLFVYDLRNPGAAPLTFDTGAGGFLNDLVVTAHGDVYITDSFRPTLWHVSADQLVQGGSVEAIPVSPEIPYTAGAFNLNGIVAFRGGRELVVVSTVQGALYRIRFDHEGGRAISQIDAPAMLGGDGLLADKGRLIVVRGAPAGLSFLQLSGDHAHATLRKVVTDASLRGPSTVARLRDRYLVVNADFATSTQPFTVTGLPRH